MTIDLVVVAVLGLCSFRVTRFVVDDTLWEGTRLRLLNWLVPYRNRKVPMWRIKLSDLLTCYWCVGIWASAGLVHVFYTAWPWQLGITGWVTVGAVAGFQSLCSTAVDRMIE